MGGIYIWTHRSNNISSNDDYEPTLFDLEISGTGGALATYTDVPLAPDTATAQGFALPSILSGVTSVKFSVKQTQGATPYTGLAEVAFDSTIPTGAGIRNLGPVAVPVPASLPLLAGALALAGLIRRRAHR